jgi:LPXTG-motif cell wall-anchored protein
MVNFDFTFHKAGKYVLLARLTSDDGKTEYVGRHPFTVGLMDTAETSAYLLFGGFLLVVGGGAGYFFWKKKKAALAV